MPSPPSPSHTRRALIIGGSLGGLFTAVLLEKQGWEVEVFERSRGELDSRGGGIVLRPEVQSVLHQAGIEPSIPLGVSTQESLVIGRQGEILERELLPQTLSAWSSLYSILRPCIADTRYHQGEMLVRLEQDASGVVAFFPSGRTERGDLLVAADGVASTVRRLVLPGHNPRYAGYVVYRGLVPEPALSPESQALFRDHFVYHYYAHSQFLQYPVPSETGHVEPGSRRHNWEWYVNTDLGGELLDVLTDQDGAHQGRSIPPGRMADDTTERLRERAAHELPPPFQELVNLTDAPFVQPILDLEVPQMAFGRVALLGDASFISRPHIAASTAKAAANALALVDCLQDSTVPVVDALQQWEPGQLQLGRRLAQRGQELGNRHQFPEGLAG